MIGYFPNYYKTMKLPKHKKGNVTAKTLEEHVRKFKPSEVFEGENSSLRRTYEEAVEKEGNERRKFYQMGYDEREHDVKSNIGMLRQWLNEDRIDDPKKFVTNEQIEKVLFLI